MFANMLGCLSQLVTASGLLFLGSSGCLFRLYWLATSDFTMSILSYLFGFLLSKFWKLGKFIDATMFLSGHAMVSDAFDELTNSPRRAVCWCNLDFGFWFLKDLQGWASLCVLSSYCQMCLDASCCRYTRFVYLQTPDL